MLTPERLSPSILEEVVGVGCAELGEAIRNGNLWMNCRSGDMGGRELNPCNPFWLSEDLRIEPGGTVYEVGTPVTLQARVRTKAGANFAQARVRIWVCKAGVGLTPSHAIDLPAPGAPSYQEVPAFSTAAQASATPGLSNWLSAAGGAWTPAATTASEGHYCLLGACWAADEGAAVPDNATTFAPCCDNHKTQRNLSVVEAKGDSQGIEFAFDAGNPNPKHIDAATIDVRHLHGPALSQGVEVDRRLIYWLRRSLRGSPYEKLPVRLSAAPLRNVEIRGITPGEPLTIGRKELVPLTLSADVPRGAPGSAHVFDIVERDLKGAVVGGLRVVVVRTPRGGVRKA